MAPSILNRLRRNLSRINHRNYVGGQWDEIGQLQFDFLRSHGLTPGTRLLDIACGSLRLGVKAIPFLQRGFYLGIEKKARLVRAGLKNELGAQLQIEKQPNIVISSAFEFEKLGQHADMAIAQSLFTHLPPEPIYICFRNLHPCLVDDGVFYATFFETAQQVDNPDKPHDHKTFLYTRSEMERFGEDNGYDASYIGDWNHPRQQVMVEYRKR